MLLVWGSCLEDQCIWAILSLGLLQMTLFHFLRRGRRRKLREHKCSLSSTVLVYGLYIFKKNAYIFCQSRVDLQCLRCTVRWFQLYTYIIFEIIFHYSLLQDIEYSSLCKTASSFEPRVQTHVSYIAGSVFTIWATRKAHSFLYYTVNLCCMLHIDFLN